jgi:hypothetical protein
VLEEGDAAEEDEKLQRPIAMSVRQQLASRCPHHRQSSSETGAQAKQPTGTTHHSRQAQADRHQTAETMFYFNQKQSSCTKCNSRQADVKLQVKQP